MNTDSKISAEQFDELRPALRRFSAGSVDLLKAVLVDGVAPIDAAQKFGVSRQNVSRLLNDARKILQGIPRNWVFLQEFMPAEMADRVRAELAAARNALDD